MKKWAWLALFGVTVAGGALYLINRNKDQESKAISDQSRGDRNAAGSRPIRPPGEPMLVPEARPGSGLARPSNPVTDPGASFGIQDSPPPPAFDNLPPPSQIYPESAPMPFVPTDADEFGQPAEPPDAYENVDPQYVPSQPVDADIAPPEEY